jgi:hypothetical protein
MPFRRGTSDNYSVAVLTLSVLAIFPSIVPGFFWTILHLLFKKLQKKTTKDN